jgi:hypothetical protein
MGKTRNQYRELGARFGCGKVADEASYTSTQWGEHIDVLRKYGKGRAKLEAFNTLRTQHDEAIRRRPEVVAIKLVTTSEARKTHEQADEFIDMAGSILSDVAKTNETLEKSLTTARGADGKAAVVSALAALLTANLPLLPEDAEGEALARRGPEIATALQAITPAKATSRTATKTDTEEIDVLDGRLIETMSEVNSAGRKAFRRLGNKALVEAFKYHHIKGKPSETSEEVHEEPPPTTGS